MLLEVTRKAWAATILRRIRDALLSAGVLSPAQHGFLPGKGTESASIQLRNAVEHARAHSQNLYLSSWDIRRAFDSVPRPLIRLAWRRVGVPDTLARWIAEMDMDSKTVVRSEHSYDHWQRGRCAALAQTDPPLPFCPAAGTGQGDVLSPMSWVVVFDILLRALALVHTEGFRLLTDEGEPYVAPDMAYADDMVSCAASAGGLQAKAHVVSAFTSLVGLQPAPLKLRAHKVCWESADDDREETLTLHMMGWTPVVRPIIAGGAIRFLGVLHPLRTGGREWFDQVRKDFTTQLRILHRRRATPETLYAVLRSKTLSAVAYRGAMAAWPLGWLEELDNVLARCLRRSTKDIPTSQRENIFQPAARGGLGFKSVTDIVLARKRALIGRMLRGDDHTRQAMMALLRRGARPSWGGLQAEGCEGIHWVHGVVAHAAPGGLSLQWVSPRAGPATLLGDRALLPGSTWRLLRAPSWMMDQQLLRQVLSVQDDEVEYVTWGVSAGCRPTDLAGSVAVRDVSRPPSRSSLLRFLDGSKEIHQVRLSSWVSRRPDGRVERKVLQAFCRRLPGSFPSSTVRKSYKRVQSYSMVPTYIQPTFSPPIYKRRRRFLSQFDVHIVYFLWFKSG